MKKTSLKLTTALCLLVAAPLCFAQSDDATPTTVIGVRNPALADGAAALKNRDAERGVELTLLGLEKAQGRRERNVALANLCAGYLLLDQLETALGYCDQALEGNDRNWRGYSNRALVYMRMGRFDEAAADVESGQALAPNASSLKAVKGMLLDETQPVTPTIVIDDRRDPDDDES